MHTARLLTVSPSMHCMGGASSGGVPAQGGVPAREVYLPMGGSTCPGCRTCPGAPPPVDRQTRVKT